MESCPVQAMVIGGSRVDSPLESTTAMVLAPLDALLGLEPARPDQTKAPATRLIGEIEEITLSSDSEVEVDRSSDGSNVVPEEEQRAPLTPAVPPDETNPMELGGEAEETTAREADSLASSFPKLLGIQELVQAQTMPDRETPQWAKARDPSRVVVRESPLSDSNNRLTPLYCIDGMPSTAGPAATTTEDSRSREHQSMLLQPRHPEKSHYRRQFPLPDDSELRSIRSRKGRHRSPGPPRKLPFPDYVDPGARMDAALGHWSESGDDSPEVMYVKKGKPKERKKRASAFSKGQGEPLGNPVAYQWARLTPRRLRKHHRQRRHHQFRSDCAVSRASACECTSTRDPRCSGLGSRSMMRRS
mgnify:CR=1 FL=1